MQTKNKKNKTIVAIILLLMFVLVGCTTPTETSKVPNLANLNKAEIEETFNSFNLDITLEFKDYFEPSISDDIFWQYDTHQIGDSLKQGDKVVIYLVQSKITLPDLKGLTKDEIITYFENIGVPNNLITFKANSTSTQEENMFVSYQGYTHNQKFDFSEDKPLVINYKRSPVLPDLKGLNEEQITNLFNDLDLLVTLDFKEFYNEKANNTFKSYGGKKVGDKIEPGEVIQIYIEKNSVRLPNLTGMTLDEVKIVLENMGLISRYVSYTPETNLNNEPNDFLGYTYGQTAGSVVSPTVSQKIRVYYNLVSIVPELTNLNVQEITKALKDANISLFEFEYILDNDKEFDLFANYQEGIEALDKFDPLDKLTIYVYENDDVNTKDETNIEYQLFISKYLDGEDYNKAIELYNPTADDIDLSLYYLAILSNGQYAPDYRISLEGVIKPKETYVIINDKAVEILLNKANQTSSNLVFDGNDVIQLRKVSNNTYIDSIYHVGNISTTMDGENFIRRSFVTAGTREFQQVQWQGYVPNYFDNIGLYPVSDALLPEFSLISDKTFQQYGMTKVSLLSVADGDTIYVKSMDPRDTTSYDGNARLRFLMVDTPETTKPDLGVVGGPYADVATNFTTVLLNASTEIYIQSDPSAGLTETYGRHLALIWFYLDEDYTFNQLSDKDGNKAVLTEGWHLLNYELIKYGLGEKNAGKVGEYQKSPIFGNRYLYAWAESALVFAQENKFGLYSGVHQD